jgi:hypothetical protein
MKNNVLLPNRFKKIGWCILIPATLFGIFVIANDYEASWLKAKVFALFYDELFGEEQRFVFVETNITNTLAGVFFITGALLVCFSKEKQEDEFIAAVRLNALLWAVAVNYTLLLLAFLFVYGGAFLTVMIYNMFTVLIIFIARFNFVLYRYTKRLSYEK